MLAFAPRTVPSEKSTSQGKTQKQKTKKQKTKKQKVQKEKVQEEKARVRVKQKQSKAIEWPFVPCTYCKNRGVKPCKKHSKKVLALENDGVTEFCSYVSSCETCEGPLHVHCYHCKNDPAEALLNHNRNEFSEWRTERTVKVEKLFRRKLLMASSKNFDIVWNLKRMTVGRNKMNPHEMVHLYLKRLEDLRSLFFKTLELKKGDVSCPVEIYVWRFSQDQALAAPKFTGMGSAGTGVKLMGVKCVFTMLYEKRTLRTDADLHRHLVHNVTHLLMANMSPIRWIGNLKGGWADEGLAHYFEFMLDKKCTTYCFEEVASNMNFKGGKWLVALRKRVAIGNVPSFALISTKNSDSLSAFEHAVAFSYIHYLLTGDFTQTGHGRKLQALLKILKQKKTTREALKKVYGWTKISLEEKWKEWVLKTYPKR